MINNENSNKFPEPGPVTNDSHILSMLFTYEPIENECMIMPCKIYSQRRTNKCVHDTRNVERMLLRLWHFASAVLSKTNGSMRSKES